MRVLGLILLGLSVYGATLAVFFPAAPVIARVEPELGPIELEGVSGRLLDGRVDTVLYTDDLLPLEFSNVGWTLAPASVFQGGVGADLRFEGYGGGGTGEVIREWNGDLNVRDFAFSADAKRLEALLPAPIAEFSGILRGDIRSLRLQQELLTTFEGTLRWSDALVEFPLQMALGTIEIRIEKTGPESHLATISAAGGEVEAEGTLEMALDGEFSTDLLFTPTANVPQGVIDGLEQIARPEADGRYRLRQSGDITELM